MRGLGAKQREALLSEFAASSRPSRGGVGPLAGRAAGSAKARGPRPSAATPSGQEVPAPGRRGRIVVVSGPSGVGKGAIVARVRAARARPPRVRLGDHPPAATRRGPRPSLLVHGPRRVPGHDRIRRVPGVGRRVRPPLRDPSASRSRWLDAWQRRRPGGQPRRRLAARSGRPTRPRTSSSSSPPSMAELERRLRTRATESEEQIRRRLATATVEMAAEPEFDETVLNDDLETAAPRWPPPSPGCASGRARVRYRRTGRSDEKERTDPHDRAEDRRPARAGRLQVHPGDPGRPPGPPDQRLLRPARRGHRRVRPADGGRRPPTARPSRSPSRRSSRTSWSGSARPRSPSPSSSAHRRWAPRRPPRTGSAGRSCWPSPAASPPTRPPSWPARSCRPAPRSSRC